MVLIASIEPQPQFPHEDMSEVNAQFLELMLANKDIVASGHQASEQLSWVFRVGHPALIRGFGKVHSDPERLAAIDHGVSVFEAASSLLSTDAPAMEFSTVNTNGVAIAAAFNECDLCSYADKAYGHFTENMQRTHEVVRTASERVFPYLVEYAALGAALAYQFELDAVE